MNIHIDYTDLNAVKLLCNAINKSRTEAHRKELSTLCVIYKHPRRTNYNITHIGNIVKDICKGEDYHVIKGIYYLQEETS